MRCKVSIQNGGALKAGEYQCHDTELTKSDSNNKMLNKTIKKHAQEQLRFLKLIFDEFLIISFQLVFPF